MKHLEIIFENNSLNETNVLVKSPGILIINCRYEMWLNLPPLWPGKAIFLSPPMRCHQFPPLAAETSYGVCILSLVIRYINSITNFFLAVSHVK